MTSELMKSVSGIRGIVGETFTPEIIVEICNAYSVFCNKGTVILGRDSRRSGEPVSMLAASVLRMSGCNVVDIGIVPTPTVQIMVEELSAAGGLVISASHNPVEWNAFKFIGPNGSFLNSSHIKKLFTLMEKPSLYVSWDHVGAISTMDNASDIHIRKVLEVLDTRAIRRSRFKVVQDSVNGAGSEVTRQLLKKLGCKVIPLNCNLNGDFTRGAEPVPENLKALSDEVKKTGADIGFAQDPDADRLAIVNEKGEPIGEEYTIVLAVEHLLSKLPGNVAINLSTTRAVDDIVQKYGMRTYRTRVGEINVVEEMLKRNVRIGGEGNGGVISPEVHLGRDSLVGIGYVLEMMAERKKPITEILDVLPKYYMKKGKVKVNFSDYKVLYSVIRKSFPEEKFSSIDGLRIEFKRHESFSGGWIHLRPSNTEPVFRIIAEGATKKKALDIYNYFSRLVQGEMG